MAQYRQSGGGSGARNGIVPDHVSIGVSSSGSRHSHHHHHSRRSKAAPAHKISIGFCVVTLLLILSISAFFYLSLQSKGEEINTHQFKDDDPGNDTDFLINVTRMSKTELKFGHGSVAHARDSRYWDKDDRRRDEDYSEEELERVQNVSVDKIDAPVNKTEINEKFHKVLDHRGSGLYNELGRNELKMYEAEFEASSKSTGGNGNGRKRREIDADDEYDDGIDIRDDQIEEYDDFGHNEKDHSTRRIAEEADKASTDLYHEDSVSVRKLVPEKRSSSKKKPKRRKNSGSCEMKMSNSSALLVEPLQSRKFARFSLQYTEREENLHEDENWKSLFAGHQSLVEREESFVARDQKINCGFVKGPKGSESTGFDLAEDDAKYISSCHIAVMSCIFGNSDRLRSPVGKTVSRMSRKNVCFVMFVDELTLQTLSSEGQMPDSMGFIGLWKIVVVKNLPYTDMRRVGKIPKLLPHRLFPSARYSIWLDSKLRLQLDPLLILEYFLWRKGHEYAISNHYDRHCLWEEVAQNKKLNKYNHTVIDEQFAFYQADGMKRFNASDPNKLLPSNVPEGSFIVRAHTPMSNLFSCLWFNEVERFTPRDQLSFAYTYHKLRRKNPEKPFYLNMFKDCERRKIAKLFRHRSEDTRNPQHETE